MEWENRAQTINQLLGLSNFSFQNIMTTWVRSISYEMRWHDVENRKQEGLHFLIMWSLVGREMRSLVYLFQCHFHYIEMSLLYGERVSGAVNGADPSSDPPRKRIGSQPYHHVPIPIPISNVLLILGRILITKTVENSSPFLLLNYSAQWSCPYAQLFSQYFRNNDSLSESSPMHFPPR
jgi:hypothetical protein